MYKITASGELMKVHVYCCISGKSTSKGLLPIVRSRQPSHRIEEVCKANSQLDVVLGLPGRMSDILSDALLSDASLRRAEQAPWGPDTICMPSYRVLA